MGETEISLIGNKICDANHYSSTSNGSKKSQTVKQVGQPVVKTYECQECGKTFSKPSKLKIHMNVHSGERPFVCAHPDCDKAYTSASHLQRHKKCHNGPKPVEVKMCELCKSLFSSNASLKKHIKTIHESPDKPYACQECGEAFRKKKLLACHLYKHGGAHAFKCTFCPLTFPLKYLYNRHMRGHKSHSCKVPDCGQVLPNWSLYRKHMAINHKRKEQDMKCDQCSEIFPTRQSLYQHRQSHVEGTEFVFELGRYVCPHRPCKRTYQYRRNLSRHILTRHLGVRFVCEFEGCGRQLISKQKLTAHMKLHENGPKSRPDSEKKRKPRKDKGSLKRAMAAKLSGAEVPHIEQKRLLQEYEVRDEVKDEMTDKVTDEVTDDVRDEEESSCESPESGWFSLSGSSAGIYNLNEWRAKDNEEVKFKTEWIREDEFLEQTDAADLQGPSETQRRNEDPLETSSDDESYVNSGGDAGDSSDEESGSGHCDDDDEDDGDDGGDDDHDDDDDDDFNEDDDDEEEDDEGEEGNGLEDDGDGEREADNHLAHGDTNGKRAGGESLSRDQVTDGGGDFGVDRDGTTPSVDSSENAFQDDAVDTPASIVENKDGIVDESCEDDERGLKRRNDEGSDTENAKRKRRDQKNMEGDGSADDLEGALNESSPNIKHLDRNVDPKIFEVSVPKEKASKKLPTEVWVSTFQKSLVNCLPEELEDHIPDVKEEPFS